MLRTILVAAVATAVIAAPLADGEPLPSFTALPAAAHHEPKPLPRQTKHPHHTLVEHVRWTPKGYAIHLLVRRGWAAGWQCLNALWQRESGWNPLAHNASSGAHGIPQALPGWKMGRGWWSNFKVQIRWGLRYIASRYGTPCGAWAHSEATGWY